MESETINLLLHLIPLQLGNTIYMVGVSTFFAVLLGLPLGVILTVSDRGGLKENRLCYFILEAIVNVMRSFPFAILMIALIPLTRLLIGTSIGTTAAIVPLTIAATPFFSRLVETNLKDVDSAVVDASLVMGATPLQTIFKVLIPEAFPSLIGSVTLTAVNVVGYSAMAGLVGGGGLGQVAIQYGYQRFNTTIMIVTVVLLILIVQLIQRLGDFFSGRLLKKRGLLHD